MNEASAHTKSLINQIFTKDQLKMLYYHACRIDIEDNNDKARMLTEFLGDEFDEIGTGTNRVAYLYTPSENREFRGGSGLVFEFALDRRGFLDAWAEFQRSCEIPQFAIKVYETNMLISVQEYVTLMDKKDFKLNEAGIKEVLSILDEDYIFEDIGFTLKNYENYGYRDNGDIVILDLGYIYPKRGNEQALSCPRCRSEIRHNHDYTVYICSNPSCRTKYEFLEIRNRMTQSLENIEDQMYFSIIDADIPDFGRLNEDQF